MTELARCAKELKDDLVEIRRAIHRHPEPAWKEKKTAALVARELRRLGCKVESSVAGTGVVGLLELDRRGPVVAIRADMDALELQEQNDVPYCSTVDGVMHACGHDGHVAAALGAASLLAERRGDLFGRVKFIFQPAEELIPGGALPMIEAGVLDRPKVRAVFALHSDPELPVGRIGVRDGAAMAAADDFTITVFGEASHGAKPHLGTDAIVLAAEVVQSLQTIPSRRVDPLHPLVITIGKVRGGTRSNIIADRVELRGTFRTLDSRVRKQVWKLLQTQIRAVVKGGGGQVEFELRPGYPVLHCAPGLNDLVRQAARDVLGKRSLVELPHPVMGSEDFAYYAERVPGTMFRLGVRNEARGITHPWHHPRFDIDEDALWMGAAVLTQAVELWLAKESNRK